MKKINILLLCIICSLTSCKKFLDAKPDYSLTTPGNLPDLQAMLDNVTYMNQRTPCYDEASADDYFLTPANYELVGLGGKAAYTWQPYTNEYMNDWASGYFVVYNANVCLEALEKIVRNEENATEWDNVKGSALFYRAMTFLKLNWTYAQVYDENTANKMGIILRRGTDFNVPSKRATISESYNQVLTDLHAALPLLPANPQHVLRPSRAAAEGMLARAYLSMRQYDLAYLHANECLKIKSNLVDYNTVSTTASPPFKSYNPEVIFHTDITTYGYSNIISNISRVDTLLYRSYQNNDLRKSIFFSANSGYHQFKGSYANRSASSRQLFTGIATDEVYLMRAECLARLDKVQEAMNDLNTLMKMRWEKTVDFPVFTATTAQEAIELILKERRKELLFRGLRWMDIKRLNKEGANIQLKRVMNGKEYLLAPNEDRYALPLPVDVVATSGVLQNPGW